MAKTEVKLTVKCTRAERELWRRAAYARGVTMSEWARKTLTANAERTLGQGNEQPD